MPETTDEKALFLELGARFGVSARRVQVLAKAVERLIPEEIEVLEQLGTAGSRMSDARRRTLCSGLVRAIQANYMEPPSDPLADVDEPMSPQDAIEALFSSEMETEKNRALVLRDCVDVAEAARHCGRSRQAIERQRREGKVLALRAGRHYRYPLWQFDSDGPAGRLPGLEQVLEHLRLTPAGAAFWLTTPKPELGGRSPRELLVRRRIKPVLRLAEQHGHMP